MSAKSGRSNNAKVYITYAAITLAILAVIFAVITQQRNSIAPVYEITVSGLDAKTPSEAQVACKTDYSRFAEVMADYEDCAWAWCGGDVVYLVKTRAVRVNADSEYKGFTGVQFKDKDRKLHEGYLIDPATEPKELGRIQLSESEEYTFDNVSMTIRVGIRSEEIRYGDAVYLWAKGDSVVYAVKPDTYEKIENRIVNFTDDGGRNHTCYILDTKID